jgi:asparagine synthase (glutamine-hydrolysing)
VREAFFVVKADTASNLLYGMRGPHQTLGCQVPSKREAARDVITDTVYRRQKHPFMSPPATLNPNAKLHDLVQDRLRGQALAAIPFFDQKKVVSLLDRIGSMDESARVANDQVLMILTSACVLQERLQLAV